jgi:hypothetical protein
MIQPGVIQIGGTFFIKIGKKHTQIENPNLKTAIAFLLGYYYVFQIEFPLPIKFVFVFFESLADLPLSIKSVVVERFVDNLRLKKYTFENLTEFLINQNISL